MRVDRKFISFLKDISVKYLREFRERQRELERKAQIYGFTLNDWFESKIWSELKKVYYKYKDKLDVKCISIYTTGGITSVEYMVFLIPRRILYISVDIIKHEKEFIRFELREFMVKKELKL